MSDRWFVPCLSQFSLTLRENETDIFFVADVLLKSNVLSLLLPEACYRKH